MPKIYHVNWFRKDANGKFLWPGFGENIRVVDWIVRRLDGEEGIGHETAVGVVPNTVLFTYLHAKRCYKSKI